MKPAKLGANQMTQNANEFTWMSEIDPRIELLKALDSALRGAAERNVISQEVREGIFQEVYEASKSALKRDAE
jgi:hypothetical protein